MAFGMLHLDGGDTPRRAFHRAPSEACEKFKAKLAKLKQERSVLRAEKS
jgi:hypothetical protein